VDHDDHHQAHDDHAVDDHDHQAVDDDHDDDQADDDHDHEADDDDQARRPGKRRKEMSGQIMHPRWQLLTSLAASLLVVSLPSLARADGENCPQDATPAKCYL